MPAISVLMKPSSSMCNMSCNYCFYCDEAQKRTQESFGYMSEQTLKNIIRKTQLNFRTSTTGIMYRYRMRFRPMVMQLQKNGASFSKTIIS